MNDKYSNNNNNNICIYIFIINVHIAWILFCLLLTKQKRKETLESSNQVHVRSWR